MDVAEVPATLDGYYALHDVRRVDWKAWNCLSQQQQQEALSEWVAACEAAAAQDGVSGLFTVLGHKGDLMHLHLRPGLEDLEAVERRFDRTALGSLMTRAYSYLSVIELSAYGAKGGDKGGDPYENPYVRQRLYRDSLPDTRFICFYPMNKRRGETDNWYMLSMQARREMMTSHGQIGRSYAGKVTQIITGSMGLDDWEWGVTLFADDPLQFKKLIYEMRFDEVSARFAEFGPFYVGRRIEPRDFAAALLS